MMNRKYWACCAMLTAMALGELASARASLGRARELLGDVSTITLLEGCCAVREERMDEARSAFDALRQAYDRGAAGPDDLAMLAAAMGESDTAVEWLTRACAQRSPFLGYVDVEPAMAPLRRDLVLDEHLPELAAPVLPFHVAPAGVKAALVRDRQRTFLIKELLRSSHRQTLDFGLSTSTAAGRPAGSRASSCGYARSPCG